MYRRFHHLLLQGFVACSLMTTSWVKAQPIEPSSPDSVDAQHIARQVLSRRPQYAQLQGKAYESTQNIKPFVTEWQTDKAGQTIHIGLLPGVAYDFVIDWGDGSNPEHYQGKVLQKIQHTYSQKDQYTVTITPQRPQGFSAIVMGSDAISSADQQALRVIKQWGDASWLTLKSAFAGCRQLDVKANDTPNLQRTYTMANMFYGDIHLKGNKQFDQWDTSHVANMTGVFDGATHFNQPIDDWDTSNVQFMDRMFSQAEDFNQPLKDWDTGQVKDMSFMFDHAQSFNQPINSWDTSHVEAMQGMFAFAKSFNQPLNNWDTSHAILMQQMFRGAQNFNQPLNNWNTSHVTTMAQMFRAAAQFNQPLDQWDTSQVADMHAMFRGARRFNEPIGEWDTHQVFNMASMFAFADAFNQPLGQWDTSNVLDMSSMFQGAQSFNQPIGQWDTSQVENMAWMFANARAFNQPLNHWQTQNVRCMTGLFLNAASFNQSLDNWQINQLRQAKQMLRGSNLSTQHYSQMLINWAQQDDIHHQVTLGAGHIQYNASAKAAHKQLVSPSQADWTIHDGGLQ